MQGVIWVCCLLFTQLLCHLTVYIYICSFEYACSKLLHWSLSLQVLPDLYLGNFKGVYKCFFFFFPLLNHLDFLHMTAHIHSHSIILSFCLPFCLRLFRRERPRTVSQEQHHAHPVHPRQRGSHPPGETPSISSSMTTFLPPTSRISHQFFKESDEARGPNRSDWLSPDPPPLPPRISAHDWSSDTVPWTGVSGLLRRKLRL